MPYDPPVIETRQAVEALLADFGPKDSRRPGPHHS